MDKDLKKQKLQKLQKKLQNRQFTIFEVLQEDIAVDWFKAGHPAFLAMLTHHNLVQMISYLINVGPPDNKMRSYKIPMVAAQILSLPMPKVFELFFMDDEEIKGDILLGRLLQYFEKPPNYVISGYVVKILMNLLVGNAPRVLDYLFKNGKIMNLPKYLESISIADFILRIVVVQDLLLNHKIKQRIQLFHKLVDIYQQNRECLQILQNINYCLCEAMMRLWSQKHKELGRFSTQIFRIIQLIIQNNNLVNQQNLTIIVMKHLVLYADEAPYLIIVLYKKIHRQLFLALKTQQTVKTQFKEKIPKFSMKNFKLLQSLHSMLVSIPDIMIKQLTNNNVFGYLLDCISKYEWNSIVLVEIEKILKLCLCIGQKTNKPNAESEDKNSQIEAIYNGLFVQSNFSSRLRELMRKESEKGKINCGYSGFLNNLCTHIKSLIKSETVIGGLIKGNQSDLLELMDNYLKNKQVETNEGFLVVHDVAKPHYSISNTKQFFRQFFDETQTINKKYQIERPAHHKEIKEEVLSQIEYENQLVYKLMTENSTEEKKSQNINQNIQ